MKKRLPPLWFCVCILIFALVWRMAGAPVSMQDLSELKIPFVQARILMPQRIMRMIRLWVPSLEQGAETIADDVQEIPDDARPVWLNVYLSEEKRLARMTLEGYVCGVVAAEMPAAYHLEALKAQAVAARTRVLRQRQTGGCTLHEGADICTDSTHCQGYATPDDCRNLWKEEYEAYRSRILTAVSETQGNAMTYEGELITVLYHAISGGKTEAVQTVFSQSLPYLVSVESRGEEKVQGYQQDLTLSMEETANRLRQAFPHLQTTAQDVQRALTVGSYTETGRVHTMLLNGTEIDGNDFRHALGLRSTWFSITADGDSITFHQRGYGHGVGMSQAGANCMAADGAMYDDILMHYYPGVCVENINGE